MPGKILVAFDDSDPAREALVHAIDLFPESEFTAVTVVDANAMPYIPNPVGNASGEGSAELQERLGGGVGQLAAADRIAADRGVDLRTEIRIGSPARTIVDHAEAFDHVVVGSHGRSGVSRLLRGSVAETVVRHSPVPVTVV